MQDEMNDIQYTKPEDPDIIKVVRCKNCKYSRQHNFFEHIYLQCERPHSEWPVIEPEHYCSYGEKRNGMDS